MNGIVGGWVVMRSEFNFAVCLLFAYRYVSMKKVFILIPTLILLPIMAIEFFLFVKCIRWLYIVNGVISFSLDFRLNKFCGEHLLIGFEKSTVDDVPRNHERKGEPVAEARIQADQSFHHLKIIKSGESNDPPGSNTDTAAANDNEKKRRKNQRIYSQVG